MTEGAKLIAIERDEQINKHGFDEAHDDYKKQELVLAATSVLMLDGDIYFATHGESPESVWPWPDAIDPYFTKIKAKDRIGQLKVAGAFIAAELDRLLRLKRADEPKVWDDERFSHIPEVLPMKSMFGGGSNWLDYKSAFTLMQYTDGFIRESIEATNWDEIYEVYFDQGVSVKQAFKTHFYEE